VHLEVSGVLFGIVSTIRCHAKKARQLRLPGFFISSCIQLGGQACSCTSLIGTADFSTSNRQIDRVGQVVLIQL